MSAFGVFLVCILPHWDWIRWIRRVTKYLRIQFNYREIRTRKTQNMHNFHAERFIDEKRTYIEGGIGWCEMQNDKSIRLHKTVGLVFFAIDNCLMSLLSTYIIIVFAIKNTLPIPLENQIRYSKVNTSLMKYRRNLIEL